eukprot:TRINITY_DN8402_c0_g1_i5.p1 TRINITY_DN8402_c0_g1~~TRINITY_DN8402_c0_g1_i5.p1  ORF type:complete len:1259 (+),score=408.35 TRINITY_DN8402_c0_g1_i5:51-3827(+)
MDSSINVAVRVRPLGDVEAARGTCLTLVENSIVLPGEKTYAFDNVFPPDIVTAEVYNTIGRDLVLSALEGVNGCMFAYGQTSSGKTHTMTGKRDSPGIIPLSIQDLFQEMEQDTSRRYSVKLAYMELYNEEARDLLASDENAKLRVRDSAAGVFVEGLVEHEVRSPAQVMQLIDMGFQKRHTESTAMNKDSSRSHAILRIAIESRDAADADAKGPVAKRVSQLNLVDLAGSESVRHTEAAGQRQREGGMINKSLLALFNVITKLSDVQRGVNVGHIPYRDSTLTRILQPALGGNARTSIICTVTSASLHQEQTKSTLDFAARAKLICNKAVVNEIVPDAEKIKRLKRELDRLKQRLQTTALPEAGLVDALTLERDKAVMLAEQVDDLSGELAQERDQVAQLQSLMQMHQQQQQAEAMILQTELQCARQLAQEQSAVAEAERQQLLASHQQMVSQLQSQINLLQADTSTALAQAQQQVFERDGLLSQLQEQIRLLQSEVSAISAERDSQSAQLQAAREMQHQLSVKNAELELTVASSSAAQATAEAQCTALAQEIANMETSHRTHVEEFDALKASSAAYQDDHVFSHEDIERLVAVHQQELNSAMDTVKSLQAAAFAGTSESQVLVAKLTQEHAEQIDALKVDHMKALQAAMSEVKEQLEQYQALHQTSEAEVADMRMNVSQSGIVAEGMRDDMNMLQSRVAELEQELIVGKEHADTALSTQAAEFEQKLAEVNAKHEATSEEADFALQEEIAQRETLEEQVETLKGKESERMTEFAALQQVHAATEQVLAEARASLEEQTSLIAMLQDQLNAANQVSVTHQQQLADHQSEVEIIAQQLADAKAASSAYKGESSELLASMTSQLTTAAARLDAAEARAAELHAERDGLLAKLTAATEHSHSLQEQLSFAELELQELSAIPKLLEDAQRNAEAMQVELDKLRLLENDVASLRVQLDASNDQLIDKDEAIQCAQSEIEQLKEQLVKAQVNSGQQEETALQLSAAINANEQLSEQMDLLQTERDLAIEAHSAAEVTVAQRDEVIAQQQRSIDEQKDAVLQLQKDLAFALDLQSQFEEQTRLVQTLRAQLDDQTAELAAKAELQEQLTASNAQADVLRMQLQDAVASKEASLCDLRDTVSSLQLQLGSSQTSSAQATPSEVEEYEARIHKLYDQLHALREETRRSVTKAYDDRDLAQKNEAALRIELDQLKGPRNSVLRDTQHRSLINDLAKLKRENTAALERIAELENELRYEKLVYAWFCH